MKYADIIELKPERIQSEVLYKDSGSDNINNKVFDEKCINCKVGMQLLSYDEGCHSDDYIFWCPVCGVTVKWDTRDNIPDSNEWQYPSNKPITPEPTVAVDTKTIDVEGFCKEYFGDNLSDGDKDYFEQLLKKYSITEQGE